MLSPQQIQKLYQEGIFGIPVSGNSLTGWWPLNGNANDYSGYGNNGVAYNVIYKLPFNYTRDSIFSVTTPLKTQPVPGILSCNSNSQCSAQSQSQLFLSNMPLEVQGGLAQTGNFDGATSYVSTGTNGLPVGAAASSFFAWINTPTSSNTPVPFGYGTMGTPAEMSLLVISVNNLYFWNGATSYSYTLSTFPFGTWTFVGWTYGGGTSINVYQGNVPQTLTVATQNVVLNAQYPSVIGSYGGKASLSQYFQGSIADAQIYSAALSANQVQKLYQEGVYGMPFTGNLVGWWPLDGNANDYSGYGNGGISSNVVYPYFSGSYNSPGLSSTASSIANEWQALGLANT